MSSAPSLLFFFCNKLVSRTLGLAFVPLVELLLFLAVGFSLTLFSLSLSLFDPLISPSFFCGSSFFSNPFAFFPYCLFLYFLPRLPSSLSSIFALPPTFLLHPLLQYHTPHPIKRGTCPSFLLNDKRQRIFCAQPHTCQQPHHRPQQGRITLSLIYFHWCLQQQQNKSSSTLPSFFFVHNNYPAAAAATLVLP